MKIDIPELLDEIKEMYVGSEIPTEYLIVKISTIYDGSMSVVCGNEIAYNYDDLCVKMFDLNVSGWEISSEISGEAQTSIIGSSYNVVTIRMVRTI